MGARYYDPKSKKFLSPDPVGFPLCLDLYSYANSDPVNFRDPDGRFASAVYQQKKPSLVSYIGPFPAAYGTTGLGSIIAKAIYPDIEDYNRESLSNYEGGDFAPKFYLVGSVRLANGYIGFTNGIMNSFTEARLGAHQISKYAMGARVLGVYNHSTGFCSDVQECRAAQLGGKGIPVYLLQKKWDYLIKAYGPDAKFLEIFHSGGAGHVRNALVSSPESVRQRIIVLAIAPSVIIPDELCFSSFNYMSSRDFVTRLDRTGLAKYGNELKVLKPHPDAEIHDHAFLSPTFRKVIKDHITSYIENYRGN